MASTPSASALSAVLRCRRNIFGRNQANKKRPSHGTGYNLGLKYGGAEEPGVPVLGKQHGWEVGPIFQEWKSFFRGERVEIRSGVFLAVTWEVSRKNTNKHANSRDCDIEDKRRKVRHKDSRTDMTTSVAILNTRLSQAMRQCQQPRLRRESGSSQTRLFTSEIRKCLGLKKYDEKSGEETVCPKRESKVFDKVFDAAASKVLCITISYLPNSNTANTQSIEPVILCWNGWTTFKNGFLILTVLVSDILRVKFGIESGRLFVPTVLKPAIEEMRRTQLSKQQSLALSHTAQKTEEDLNGDSGDVTDQKVEPGSGSIRTNGESQSLGGESIEVGKLD